MALVSQDRCEASHYGEPDLDSSTSLQVAFSILSQLHSFARVRRIEYGGTFRHRMETYVVDRIVEFESRWLRVRPYTLQ
jgi:hypothetical protein